MLLIGKQKDGTINLEERDMQRKLQVLRHAEKIGCFQYTAIDDATRVRALNVCDKQPQANGQDFVDHIIEKFPFRIKETRTDEGHDFEAQFSWHVEDHGIRHAHIKRETPQLNGR
jgi:hypothetical protein